MNKTFLLTAASIAIGGHSLCAQSVWLPESGQMVVTPSYSYQTFKHYYEGKVRSTLPNNLTQHSTFLNLEYGLARNFAADITFGYTRTRFNTGGGATLASEGLTDTQLGLRYRFAEESAARPWMPSLALRAGAIVAGSYDVLRTVPANTGDGANGFEVSLLTGKTFGKSGFGIFADIGYRWRDHAVPNDLFGRAGIFQQIGRFTLGADYRQTRGQSGGDIGGPGFGTAYGFAQTKEIEHMVDGAITYTDAGGRGYQFTYSRTLDGRNTGEKSIFSLSISVPWQVR